MMILRFLGFSSQVAGVLRWPNTVFVRAFADAIQHVHKDFKKKHAVNRAIILFTQTRAHCVIFLYN